MFWVNLGEDVYHIKKPTVPWPEALACGPSLQTAKTGRIKYLLDSVTSSPSHTTQSLSLSPLHHTHTKKNNLPLGSSAAHNPAHSRSRAAHKSCSGDPPHPSQPDGNTAK